MAEKQELRGRKKMDEGKKLVLLGVYVTPSEKKAMQKRAGTIPVSVWGRTKLLEAAR